MLSLIKGKLSLGILSHKAQSVLKCAVKLWRDPLKLEPFGAVKHNCVWLLRGQEIGLLLVCLEQALSIKYVTAAC